jgi:hypothetical protein
MIRAFIIALLVMLAPAAQAQQPYSPERGGPQWNQRDNAPRWCRHYDRRDYYRELRACGEDRRCRWDVRRKGERCGLR